MESIALDLHLDDLGVGEEPVEDGGRRGHIAEELPPVFRGPVGRDEGGDHFVTADEDLEHVFGRAGTELFHAEVLEHEQVHAGELFDEVASLPRGLRFEEVLGEVEGASEDHPVPGADRADRDCDGGVRLADSGRADQKRSQVGRDEPSGGEIDELGAGDLKQAGIMQVKELSDFDFAFLCALNWPWTLLKQLRVSSFALTSASFESLMLSGNHFFLGPSSDEILWIVESRTR